MKFTNEEFENFREDVKKALKDVEKKYCLDIDCGSISYDEFEFSAKLLCLKRDPNLDVQKTQFERYCGIYGFKAEDYKKCFLDPQNGKTYQFDGFNPKASKNVCMFTCLDNGKKYVGPIAYVKSFIK